MGEVRKRALVIGSTGQDGTYLREQLRLGAYEIWNLSSAGLWLEGVGSPQPLSVLDPSSLGEFFQKYPPDELYYLAAYHHASQERGLTSEGLLWEKSLQVNVQGWVNCLLAIKDYAPTCHAMYASSSHIFGRPEVAPQTETTPFAPVNVYGISKVAGMQAARFYRTTYGLRASCVILYNHESPLRSEKFVSQRVIQTLHRIRQGKEQLLFLGDLEAVVDWGYAPDYVAAMRRITQLPEGDDYIVATGQSHRVRDFVYLACAALDLSPEEIVRENPQLLGSGYRRMTLVGDSSKLRARTGWKPSVDFAQMVRLLVESI